MSSVVRKALRWLQHQLLIKPHKNAQRYKELNSQTNNCGGSKPMYASSPLCHCEVGPRGRSRFSSSSHHATLCLVIITALIWWLYGRWTREKATPSMCALLSKYASSEKWQLDEPLCTLRRELWVILVLYKPTTVYALHTSSLSLEKSALRGYTALQHLLTLVLKHELYLR